MWWECGRQGCLLIHSRVRGWRSSSRLEFAFRVLTSFRSFHLAFPHRTMICPLYSIFSYSRDLPSSTHDLLVYFMTSHSFSFSLFSRIIIFQFYRIGRFAILLRFLALFVMQWDRYHFGTNGFSVSVSLLRLFSRCRVISGMVVIHGHFGDSMEKLGIFWNGETGFL